MSKKIPLGLKYAAKHHRNKITEAAHFLNCLPIQDDYKALFLDVYATRGLQNLFSFRNELVDIAQNGCDVTKMFLEEKLCGISVIHKIVVNASKKDRAEVYREIKNNGVKNSWEEIEKFLLKPGQPTLFSGKEEEC